MPETCDGTDENCDLVVDEGDPGGGVACVTGTPGACAPGATRCLAGTLECLPNAAPSPETCDGTDEDCDGAVDNGLVRACSTPCGDGVETCSLGAWGACSALAPAPELCDGLDNDCDPATPDGSVEPTLGAVCDGPDSDLCAEGSYTCTLGALACADATDDTLDVCGFGNEDCDATSPDGSEHPGFGATCDSTVDTDLCATGTRVCSGPTLTCSDDAASTLDLCGFGDEDCDASSPDGSEQVGIGDACDGIDDGDSCRDGARACITGVMTCVDVEDVPTTCETMLDTGDRHGCAPDSTGAVRCWGSNSSGQLGDNSNSTRSTPVPVVGLSGVAQLALGYRHSCAVLTDGTAHCWGDNDYSQLGDGTLLDRSTPTPVVGLPEREDAHVVGLTLGNHHTCALTNVGSVYCWGRNQYSQLGLGTIVDSLSPALVQLGTLSAMNAAELAVGYRHTCIRRTDGTIYCWGDNAFGQLGDDTTIDNLVPVLPVFGLTTARSLAAGFLHNCARLADGNVWCWGWGLYGQRGDGTTTSLALTPVLTLLP